MLRCVIRIRIRLVEVAILSADLPARGARMKGEWVDLQKFFCDLFCWTRQIALLRNVARQVGYIESAS